MNVRGRTCASCARFPLASSIEHGGAATCAIFEKPAEWNDRACVLHELAQDYKNRKVLVMKLSKQEVGDA